jgi:hypothetical protein
MLLRRDIPSVDINTEGLYPGQRVQPDDDWSRNVPAFLLPNWIESWIVVRANPDIGFAFMP